MQPAAQCHQYARDCVRWAARSNTEQQRKGFLEIARAWREAALLIETSSFEVDNQLELDQALDRPLPD